MRNVEIKKKNLETGVDGRVNGLFAPIAEYFPNLSAIECASECVPRVTPLVAAARPSDSWPSR